jgi:hypothetical protein
LYCIILYSTEGVPAKSYSTCGDEGLRQFTARVHFHFLEMVPYSTALYSVMGNLKSQGEPKAVESNCATASLSIATVPSGQYAYYDGSSSQAICSVDANLANQNEGGWTTISGKHKKKDQESKETRKKMKVSMAGMKVQHGVDWLFLE